MSETFNPLNEQNVMACQAEILSAAQDLRSGTLPFIEGVRKLAALRFQVSSSGEDPDFISFVAVDSETDHLPPQTATAHCTNEWLAKCEAEVQEVILVHNSAIFAACDRLIKRFSK
jgi:hypothetical protein